MTPTIWQYVFEALVGCFVAIFSGWAVGKLNGIQHTVDGTNAQLREALQKSKEETLEAVKEALAFERAREAKP